MLVSSTSMNAAIATTTPMSQGLYFGRQGAGGPGGVAGGLGLVDINFGIDGHSGPQTMVVVLAGVNINADRKALHHLHVVAGSILGRQQAEARTARTGDSRHRAFVLAAVGVDTEGHALSRLHQA